MQALATVVSEPQEPCADLEKPRAPRGAARFILAALARPDLRNGTLSLLDQAVVSATSFGTSVIIGRASSKQELGVFYLALTIVYLARGIQEQLVSAPYVVYYHGRRDADQALYTGSSLLHQLGLSAVALAILLGIQGLLALGIGPAGLSPAVWVLIGALPFLQLREFIRRLAIAHLQMGTAIAIDVCVAVFQLGALGALAYFQQLSVTLAYGVMGVACAIACCAWLLARNRSLQFAWAGAVTDWWHNWGFARWALASHMIGFATPYIMPWIIAAERGSADAGVFAACVSIVGTASMFITGLAAFLIPRAALAFSQGGVRELRRILRVAAAVYASVLGAFALFVLLSGDFLLVLAFGGKYAGYGAVLGVLALSMMALSMGLTAGVGLWAIDRPDANIAADVCTLAATLVIVLCLLGPLGVLGAALGDLGGKVAGALVRYATLRRLLNTVPRPSEA
jgi:O-antigen/teichoic acid export membrane protein